MNLQRDSDIREAQRRDHLHRLEDRWQIVDFNRSQPQRPFFPTAQAWLQQMRQVRRVRIQVVFEVQQPCPEA